MRIEKLKSHRSAKLPTQIACANEPLDILSISSYRSCQFDASNKTLFLGDDYTDVFVWSRSACLDPTIPNGQNEKLLSRTLTGHNGLVHSIECTATSLISCDVTGLIIERDFWNCLREKESLRWVRFEAPFAGQVLQS